ncbi:uncharacterized protein G2W53_009691 [Senna tora]|uniref:Uncharacterized protein n=1 Tax=Senna tora TaxID=362788 RepID=A0A834WYF8_9FABA|nr:uncharacterized protein G2W53_009691 [Senna tora]
MKEELKKLYVKREKMTNTLLNKFALTWNRPEMEVHIPKRRKVTGNYMQHDDSKDVIMQDSGSLEVVPY